MSWTEESSAAEAVPLVGPFLRYVRDQPGGQQREALWARRNQEMGFVIVLALFLVSGWILFVTFQRLSTRRVGIAWWLAFCTLVVVGVGTGYWLGFDFEYNISPHLRVVSFPIPVCAFHFEHGHWVDYPSPNWFAYLAAFTNVVLLTAFAVLPVLLASLFRHRTAGRAPKAAEPHSDGDKASR